MNERLTAVTGQMKQALAKVRDGWREQETKRKRQIIIGGLGLIAIALGIVIIMNISAGRFVPLYPGMSRDESVRAAGILAERNIPARVLDQGGIEVPQNKVDTAIGQLAMQGIPSSTLDYSILEKAGGLTTTDAEKRLLATAQMQNRLQDIIKTFDDVEAAFVTLNPGQNSNRVWDTELTGNSAGVKLNIRPGGTVTAGQVEGIRYLVGSSTGIDPSNVSVIDSSGNVLAAAGDNNDMSTAGTKDFLQRLGFEEEVEKRLSNKVENILSLPFPDANDYRISVTALLDWDAMIRESMEYRPLEGTDHGVVNREERRATMGMQQFTEGVVGETDNTDIPTYADLNNDGEPDAVDYYSNREFLVSYIKEQVERNGAVLSEVSIAVMVRGTLEAEKRQTLRESIAGATNVPIERIVIQGVLDPTEEDNTSPVTGQTILGLPALFVYIAAGVLIVALIALIIVSMLRRRGKKKREAEALAAQMAEQEEAERIQREIEERKNQLKKAAIGDQSEDAITEEVRDFAKSNPEITANLLRNWLREGEA